MRRVFRSHTSGQPKFLQPHGTLIHAVEADFLMLVAGQAEHLNRQGFDGAQQLAASFQHQKGIGSREFD